MYSRTLSRESFCTLLEREDIKVSLLLYKSESKYKLLKASQFVSASLIMLSGLKGLLPRKGGGDEVEIGINGGNDSGGGGVEVKIDELL